VLIDKIDFNCPGWLIYQDIVQESKHSWSDVHLYHAYLCQAFSPDGQQCKNRKPDEATSTLMVASVHSEKSVSALHTSVSWESLRCYLSIPSCVSVRGGTLSQPAFGHSGL